MDVTMVIPTYWGRATSVGWQEGDAVYDHPTPLDQEGTLLGAMQSMEILADKDFRVVILAIATAKAIEGQVEEKVARIIQSASRTGIETYLFGPSHLKGVHDLLRRNCRNAILYVFNCMHTFMIKIRYSYFSRR